MIHLDNSDLGLKPIAMSDFRFALQMIRIGFRMCRCCFEWFGDEFDGKEYCSDCEKKFKTIKRGE